MLRDQHNANAYDLHHHQLSWKWIPWLEQFAWLRNATQLQPGDFVYRSGGCKGQHLRNSRALQLRSSQHMSAAQQCKGPHELAGWVKHIFLCKRDAFLGVLPHGASMGCLLPWAPPHSSTPIARLLLCLMRNSFSFLSLSKEENSLCPETIPSS